MRNERGKNLKPPKTVEKPQVADIKAFTTEQIKNTAKLSKPIKESETTTQLTKTVEKPNIADIKLAAVEQLKNCY